MFAAVKKPPVLRLLGHVIDNMEHVSIRKGD